MAGLAAALLGGGAAAAPRAVHSLADHAAACPTDQTRCLQAAIDAAEAAGGGIVHVPPRPGGGCWEIPGRVRIARSGIVLEGDGWASCLHGGIDVAGSEGPIAPASAAPVRLDVRIAVPPELARATAPGDHVHVNGRTALGGVLSLVSPVEAVEGAPDAPSLRLLHPVPVDVAGAALPRVEVLRPIEGIEVRDLRLTGAGLVSAPRAGLYHGLWISRVARSRFERLWLSDFDGAAVSAEIGLQNHFSDLLDEGSGGRDPASGDAMVAAISLMWQTEASLGGAIRTLAPYGVGIFIGPASYGDFSSAATMAVHARSRPTAHPGTVSGRGVKLVGVVASFLPSAISLNNGATGFAMTSGTELNIGPRLISRRNGAEPTAAPDGIGLWHNGEANRRNVEGPVRLEGNALLNLDVWPTDDDNDFLALQADAAPLRNQSRGTRVLSAPPDAPR